MDLWRCLACFENDDDGGDGGGDGDGDDGGDGGDGDDGDDGDGDFDGDGVCLSKKAAVFGRLEALT